MTNERKLTFVTVVGALLLQSAHAAGRPPVADRLVSAEVDAWRAGHANRPLWIDHARRLRPEATLLIALIKQSGVDELDPATVRLPALEKAARQAAKGSAADAERADALLSQALVAWAQAMRAFRPGPMAFADLAAIPAVPRADLLLQEASDVTSLSAFLTAMPWMHPAYTALRTAWSRSRDPRQRRILKTNMMRARALPGTLQPGRYILVDIAAARLDMVENGVVRDSMRVVVGRADNPTPMLAGLLRYAVLNPYWNVPPDLAASRIAPRVISDGVSFLDKSSYDVLDGWTDRAAPIDPRKVDWNAAAAGRLPDLHIRQRPGPGNSMGQVKLIFPNDAGIYLHDTDDRSVFDEPARTKSGGCIRLQDAAKLVRWLFGRDLVTRSATPEMKVALPQPVPIYLTYLTAEADGAHLVPRADIYHRDRADSTPPERDAQRR